MLIRVRVRALTRVHAPCGSSLMWCPKADPPGSRTPPPLLAAEAGHRSWATIRCCHECHGKARCWHAAAPFDRLRSTRRRMRIPCRTPSCASLLEDAQSPQERKPTQSMKRSMPPDSQKACAMASIAISAPVSGEYKGLQFARAAAFHMPGPSHMMP